jgi:beta-ribofuranosylaminobenzene 5'-phosphate synthase
VDDFVSLIAPARLHFGFLDPTGLSGRQFASLGLVIEGYNVELEARRSKTLIITGDALDEETAKFFRVTITRLKKQYGFADDFKIVLKEKPPRHSGFGSGTQLALALSRALLEIINLKPRTEHLSLAVNRGKRSGIGILGFDKGGFIVDGGKLTDARQPPLISRVCFPKNWKILLVMQDKTSDFYGDREIKALEGLPKITKEKSSTLCRETLLRVIPAIIDKDFDSFAKGLTNIQNLMGEIFFNAYIHKKMAFY